MPHRVYERPDETLSIRDGPDVVGAATPNLEFQSCRQRNQAEIPNRLVQAPVAFNDFVNAKYSNKKRTFRVLINAVIFAFSRVEVGPIWYDTRAGWRRIGWFASTWGGPADDSVRTVGGIDSRGDNTKSRQRLVRY